jgi:N-acetylglutamate synthase-like GNAT family acetyltransferase
MNDYEIKLADHFNLPDIIEVLEELELDMEDLDDDDWIIATHSDEVIGVGRLRFFEDACELSSLGVLEEFRNKGVGNAIINSLLNTNDTQNVYVVTDISSFFEKNGFHTTIVFPESIQNKLQRCINELQCNNPKVLVRQFKIQ